MGTPQPAAPNPALDTFLAELPGLGPSELMMLSADPPGGAAMALEQARGRARRVAAAAHRSGELDRLRAAIVTWSGANGAASGVYAPVSPPSDLLLADLRTQAMQAILDAAAAIALAGLLDDETRRVLGERWTAVHTPEDPDPDA